MTRSIAAGLVVAALFASRAGAQTPPPKGAPEATKREASVEHLARMKAAVKQVTGAIEAARAEKDVVKLNCVNEKLTQMRAFVRVAEQADAALREALAARAAGDAELSRIAVARTKVDGLRGEAERCAGGLAYVVEEGTTVEVIEPSNLASEDAIDHPGSAREARTAHLPAPPVVRPPPASRWY